MDRMEFLNELAVGLAVLERADRKLVLDYYNEMILDGMESGKPEETVIAELGTPEQVAAQVLTGYGIRQGSAQVQAEVGAGQVSARVQAEAGAGQVSVQAEAGYSAGTGHETAKPLEYTFEGTGLRIEIRARDTALELRRTKNDRPRVLAYGCREEWLTPEVTGEAFRLTLRPPMFFPHLLFMLQTGTTRRLVLELPEGFADGVNLKTTNAPITGENLRLGGKVRLNATNNKLALEDCQLETLSAGSTNGSLTLTGLSGQKCRAETSNGRITAENCHFAKKLLLATSNAPVRVGDIAAPVIALTTSNGPIKGWVRGREEDYAVTSGTSNARNELRDTSDRTDRPGRLLAETSNAKIQLRFAQSEDEQEDAAWTKAHVREKQQPGEEKAGGLMEELTGLKDELAGLGEELAGFGSDLTNELKDRLEGLKDELEGMKDELAGFGDELKDEIKDRLEGLKDELEGLKDEMEELEEEDE